MPTSKPNDRPTFEDFCKTYRACQQDGKWRLMIGTGSKRFTIFALEDLDDLQRAQRAAWEDYETFLRMVADESRNPKRHRLGG